MQLGAAAPLKPFPPQSEQELESCKIRAKHLEGELAQETEDSRRKHSGTWRLRQEVEQLRKDLGRKVSPGTPNQHTSLGFFNELVC